MKYLILILISSLLFVGCGTSGKKVARPPNKTISGVMMEVEYLRAANSYEQPVAVTFEDDRVVVFTLNQSRGPFVIKKGQYQVFEINRWGDVLSILDKT